MSFRRRLCISFVVTIILTFLADAAAYGQNSGLARYKLTGTKTWQEEVPVGTPIHETEAYPSFSQIFGPCYVENLDNPLDKRTLNLSVRWDISAYNPNVPGVYPLIGEFITSPNALGIIENPDGIRGRIEVKVSPPRVPVISENVYRSGSSLLFVIDGLDYNDQVRFFRSDDYGETWYDFTGSEDLIIQWDVFIVEGLSEGIAYGFKAEVNGQWLIRGLSEPIYVMLEKGTENVNILGGDRNAGYRDPNPPRNQNNSNIVRNAYYDDSFSGHVDEYTSGSSISSDGSKGNSALSLSNPQLNAIVKLYPENVPLIIGDTKILIPTGFLTGLRLAENQEFRVETESEGNSLTVLFYAGGERIINIQKPYTLYFTYSPQGNSQRDLLTFQSRDGGIIPSSFYDTAKKSMVMRTSRTGAFKIIQAKPIEFSDMNGHFGKPASVFLSSRGIVKGIGGGRFNPDGDVKVCEFVTILYMLQNEGQSAKSTGKWYKPYMDWAVERGIINRGLSPEKTLTREEAALYLYRFAVGNGVRFNPEAVASYTDTGSISKHAKKAVMAITDLGVLKGFPDGGFHPGLVLTRAQCSEIIKNYILLTV